jgi:hypothetical protein
LRALSYQGNRQEGAPVTGDKAMEHNDETRAAMARRLLDAIDLVRKDVAAVEIWAQAVSGFVEPIPKYEPRDVSPWLPREQGRSLEKSDKRS